MASTLGALCNLVTRMIRIAVWTGLLPICALVRLATASRYCINNAMKEFFSRFAEEWVDLGVALIAIPIGLCKVISPHSCNNTVTAIADYYLRRTDREAAELI